jgi:hypothetical protein
MVDERERSEGRHRRGAEAALDHRLPAGEPKDENWFARCLRCCLPKPPPQPLPPTPTLASSTPCCNIKCCDAGACVHGCCGGIGKCGGDCCKATRDCISGCCTGIGSCAGRCCASTGTCIGSCCTGLGNCTRSCCTGMGNCTGSCCKGVGACLGGCGKGVCTGLKAGAGCVGACLLLPLMPAAAAVAGCRKCCADHKKAKAGNETVGNEGDAASSKSSGVDTSSCMSRSGNCVRGCAGDCFKSAENCCRATAGCAVGCCKAIGSCAGSCIGKCCFCFGPTKPDVEAATPPTEGRWKCFPSMQACRPVMGAAERCGDRFNSCAEGTRVLCSRCGMLPCFRGCRSVAFAIGSCAQCCGGLATVCCGLCFKPCARCCPSFTGSSRAAPMGLSRPLLTKQVASGAISKSASPTTGHSDAKTGGPAAARSPARSNFRRGVPALESSRTKAQVTKQPLMSTTRTNSLAAKGQRLSPPPSRSPPSRSPPSLSPPSRSPPFDVNNAARTGAFERQRTTSLNASGSAVPRIPERPRTVSSASAVPRPADRPRAGSAGGPAKSPPLALSSLRRLPTAGGAGGGRVHDRGVPMRSRSRTTQDAPF